jgi:hypothetical protein
MVAEVSAVPMAVALQPGVRLLPVTDEAGVGLLIDVHERVFGTDHSRLRRSLLAQLRDHPEVTAMVVAMAGDRPVCGSSSFPVPASPACGAAEPCPASAARASTAPWSPTAPGWPPTGATTTCTWTPHRTASPSWPASGSPAWPAPRPTSGIAARRREPGHPA